MTDPHDAQRSTSLAGVADHRLLGVRVSTMTIAQMNELVGEAVRTRQRFLMVSQNLHSVYTLHRHDELRRTQELATRIRIDGTPIVYFGRWLGLPLRMEHRTGWMDYLDPFMSAAVEGGWRVFYLGSKPGVAAKGAAILRERYPGLSIEVEHGYFSLDEGSADLAAVLRTIEAAAPDVLIVGMGMPRQERFVLRAADRLAVPAILTAGACIDYVAGEIPIPPRWLGALGLEWAYRLVSEPRRLWRRYLVEPWFAIGLFATEWWALKVRRRP